MARKELGYVEMEWVCPRCGSRNPGPQTTCSTCGGPQPQDVKFQQREGQQLIHGEAADQAARTAADVHCAYCGTRNKADATVCIQCGADLKDAARRESGEVVGAYSSAPAAERPCPNCGQMNSGGAQRCSNCGAALSVAPTSPVPPAVQPTAPRQPVKLRPVMVILGVVGIIAAVILCIVVISALGHTETLAGTVQNTTWETLLSVEALQPVQLQGWESDIPSDAAVGNCEYRYAYTASEPQPVSTEVCGTPYTVDQGTGFGQVVQDCTYETYAQYCDYTVTQWVTVDQLALQGNDLAPRLPNAALASGQRAGASTATYSIQFTTSQGVFTWQTKDLDLFQMAQPGSHWSLEIDRSGNIVSAQPVP